MMHRRAGCILLCLAISCVIAGFSVWPGHKKRDAWTLSTVHVQVGQGHGSGVQILPGYILTAAHVATQKDLKVRAQNGETATAHLLWKNDEYDVALLRVQGLHAVGVSPLQCEPPPVGLQVKAIGNPGPYEFAHSWGRISAGAEERFYWKSAILVDITSGQGASGGPILNMRGAVVGIVVGIHMAFPGYMIVVPSSAICTLFART